MRKGQIQQVFLYILTIVLVGFVLLIGYKAISGLISKGCEVEKATFKTDIESMIARYNTYESLNRETINAPCDFSEVCFVDNDNVIKGTRNINPNRDIIKQSANARVEKNIFLYKPELTEPIGYKEEIEIGNPYFICINETNGKFRIQFRGTGKNTKIEPYE